MGKETSMFQIGQSVGDYEILGVLGSGGMGQVYRVRNIISNRVEAMKVLLANLVAESDVADRFMAEIRTVGRLDHANIAKLHTAFKFNNQLVMLMEYVEGANLAETAKPGRLPLDETLRYVSEILSALSYAHEQGVVHRDIKPSNVMITPQGAVKLMDFGIAKSNLDPAITRTGTTIGSLLYMSPEQVQGTPADARSDVYSVGILLYELATGKCPFEGDTTFAILEQQLRKMPQPPVERDPAIPQALNEIILTALAKEPGQRFQKAEAFRKALQNVREQRSASQVPTVPVKPLPSTQQPTEYMPIPPARVQAPQRKSHRSLWMAAGAVACIGVLAAAITIVPRFWNTEAANPPSGLPANSLPAKSSPQMQNLSAAKQPVATSASPVPNGASQLVTAPAPHASPTASNQTDNAAAEASSKSEHVSARTSRQRVADAQAEPTRGLAFKTPAVSPPAPTARTAPAQVEPQQPPIPDHGPSQQELEKLNDSLIQLRARADAVKDSLERMREQQAAAGLGLRQDIAASASRLETYLQAAEAAAQSNALESAKKNMDRADAELTKLEAFLGR